MPPIVWDESPTDLKAELAVRLKECNERHAGPCRSELVAISIRNESGQLLAGLSGEVFWNALYVDMLWVDERHRRQHHGRSLLKSAEDVARRRGCDIAYMSTFDFQAPSFYATLGYRVFGELAGVPRGSKRVWLWKALSV